MADAGLIRAVGTWGLAAAIVNLTIAGSIFALPGTLAASLGASAALVFVLGAILFIPIMLCFAAAGSRIKTSGGPYRYVEAAFGPLPGFLIAALLWISSVSGSGGIAAAFADQVGHTLPWLAQPWPRAALLLAVYSSLALLNARGVKASTAVITIFAYAKTLPLIVLALLGLRYLHAGNFASVGIPLAGAPAWSSLGTALILVVFAYSGVETALAPSGEVRDTDKVVPKAVIAGVTTVVALYVLIQIVAQGVLGPALAGHPAPLVAIGERVIDGGGVIVAVTAAISLLGSLQGDLLGSSRLLYALARDGLLPRPLASVTRGGHVPLIAVATHAILGWMWATAGSFTALALVSGGAFCLVYVGCAAAAWQLQRRGISETPSPMKLPGGALLPVLGIAAFAAILATLERREWLAIACAVAVIGALYALTQRRRGRPITS